MKKKYRELSIVWHPDHSKGDGSKFRALKKAYDVLMDPERRAKYDANGVIDSHVYIVTDSVLNSCRNRYRGSESEQQSIRNSWIAHRGNVVRTMNDVPFMWGNFADPLDAERIRFEAIINEMIRKELVPANFTMKRRLELKDEIIEVKTKRRKK